MQTMCNVLPQFLLFLVSIDDLAVVLSFINNICEVVIHVSSISLGVEIKCHFMFYVVKRFCTVTEVMMRVLDVVRCELGDVLSLVWFWPVAGSLVQTLMKFVNASDGVALQMTWVPGLHFVNEFLSGALCFSS